MPWQSRRTLCPNTGRRREAVQWLIGINGRVSAIIIDSQEMLLAEVYARSMFVQILTLMEADHQENSVDSIEDYSTMHVDKCN